MLVCIKINDLKLRLRTIAMTHHTDKSFKDRKYFIDQHTYNCPFCKRNNVKYSIVDKGDYDCDLEQKMYFYIIECSDCEKKSFHLTKYCLAPHQGRNADYPNRFPDPIEQLDGEKNRKKIIKNDIEIDELDDVFIFHQPNSSFTIDPRINTKIREQLIQSKDCLNSNFLTGATACLRKAMYRLLKLEKISEKEPGNDTFIKHEERIEMLKKKHPQIDSDLLDDLKSIQCITSIELHENDYPDFSGKDLKLLQEVFKEVLYELYVAPEEKKLRKTRINALRKKSSS